MDRGCVFLVLVHRVVVQLAVLEDFLEAVVIDGVHLGLWFHLELDLETLLDSG